METKQIVSLSDDHNVVCPCCGSQYLGHTAVLVYWRDHEDSLDHRVDTSAPTSSQTERLSLEGPILANPSTRRDGIRIHMECEDGCNVPDLCITQHKGLTQLFWDQ